ncbi:unnamed protein product [Rotaria magnacalcarata]|uniref:Uncharacterized protein n=1 Tax=Rotaria magnacalcarata TaxID=392030 RepID=A0A8S2U3F5_9BILA|nr:unnamed protein product [Rotaria magnacalcarata]
MTASVHLFVDALDAIENENFNEAVRILTTMIDLYQDPTEEKNKPVVILFLKHRCQAYFSLDNHKDTLVDLQRLQSLGYKVDDDATLCALLL